MPWIGRLAGGGGVSLPRTTDNILYFKSVSRPWGVDCAMPLTGWEDPPLCPSQPLWGNLCGSGDPGPLVLGQHLRPK